MSFLLWTILSSMFSGNGLWVAEEREKEEDKKEEEEVYVRMEKREKGLRANELYSGYVSSFHTKPLVRCTV